MKIAIRNMNPLKIDHFSISLFLLSLTFVLTAQNETERKWQYELAMGFSYGHSSRKELVQLPISAKVTFQNWYSRKIALGIEFSPTVQSGNYEVNDYENFLKLNVQYLHRLRYFERERWLGFGIQTGTSGTIVRENKSSFGRSLSSFERLFYSNPIGVQLIWQEYYGNFFYSFNLNHNFIRSKEIRTNFGTYRDPLFFTQKIGFKLSKTKKKLTEGEDFLLPNNNPIDSFYNRWNFTGGFILKLAPNRAVGSSVSAAFFEGNLRTGNFEYGVQIDSRLGYNINSNGEQYSDALSTYHLYSFGILSNIIFQLDKMDYFFGLKLGGYKLPGSFSRTDPNGNWDPEFNVGYALRAGYQVGKFRHTIAYNFTGENIPNYLSSSIGINIGFSKYYRN